MSGDPEHDDALAFWQPCGCLDGVTVLTGCETEAYKQAARAAARGCRIEPLTVKAFKERNDPWECPDHAKKPKQMPVFGEPIR